MGDIVGRTIVKAEKLESGHYVNITLDNGVVLWIEAQGHQVAPPVAPPPAPVDVPKSIYDFKVGDRIEVFNVSPKMLEGATGTVTGRGTKRVKVKMDVNPMWGPKWSGANANCPPSILRKI